MPSIIFSAKCNACNKFINIKIAYCIRLQNEKDDVTRKVT